MSTAQATSSRNGDERRDYQRWTKPPLFVSVGGKTYVTINWSLGGILLDAYDGQLTAGSLVTVNAIGVEQKQMQDVEIRARVIRGDNGSGVLAITFLGLDTKGYDLLREYLRGDPEPASVH